MRCRSLDHPVFKVLYPAYRLLLMQGNWTLSMFLKIAFGTNISIIVLEQSENILTGFGCHGSRHPAFFLTDHSWFIFLPTAIGKRMTMFGKTPSKCFYETADMSVISSVTNWGFNLPPKETLDSHSTSSAPGWDLIWDDIAPLGWWGELGWILV